MLGSRQNIAVYPAGELCDCRVAFLRIFKEMKEDRWCL